MNTKPITESEYASLRISALPSRPTASSAFGGKGYTASQLKEAFDRLPLLLIERFNSLLEDLAATGKGSLVSTIPTGLESNHTLAQFFEDVKNGMLATYLSVEGESLSAVIAGLKDSLERAERLCADAESGALADTLPVGGEPLSAVITELKGSLERAERLCADAESGALADTLPVGGEPLSAVIAELKDSLERAERLCADAESGALVDTLPVGGEPLSAVIAELSEAVDALQKDGGERTLDGGHPKDRI